MLNSWSKIYISKFFDNVGGVYNKFIIITVTWSKVPDQVTVIIIYIFYDGAADMQIWALLTEESLILRWPLRPLGLLFEFAVY